MQLDSDNAYLKRDKLRLKKWRNAKKYQVIQTRAINFALMSLFVGACIYLFYYPHIRDVFASTDEAGVVEEEPAIPEPSIVSAEPEVKVEVAIEWTREQIEKEIRKTFYETPNTAVAVATEEGGLNKERQSDIRKNGVREPSFCTFQIHEPTWGKEAKRLGYGDYKTNPAHCIAMARHIYDTAGQSWSDWSAYNNGSYWKHL